MTLSTTKKQLKDIDFLRGNTRKGKELHASYATTDSNVRSNTGLPVIADHNISLSEEYLVSCSALAIQTQMKSQNKALKLLTLMFVVQLRCLLLPFDQEKAKAIEQLGEKEDGDSPENKRTIQPGKGAWPISPANISKADGGDRSQESREPDLAVSTPGLLSG